VATQKIQTLVVYEDEKPELELVARGIAERLDLEKYSIVVRSASSATVSEILAAGLLFFGADSVDAASYREIARVLKGMSLAGKRAAFFGSAGSAVAWLRGLCADTDVSAAHADLVGRRSDHTALATWLRGIT
jgi:hypothetical protein